MRCEGATALKAFTAFQSLKAYGTYFRIRLINSLQYRAAAWGGLVTQFFWGFMEIQLYGAFYAEHGEQFPMALPHLVSYIWLRQAFLTLLNTWKFDNDIFTMILNGNVAYELCRPASVYGMWFTRTLAQRIAAAALRCWPILLTASLLPQPWGLRFSPDMATFAWFLLSLLLALAVTTAFLLIIYGSCFFTTSTQGLRAVLTPVSDLLSGGLIPLPFMPDWLGGVIRYSPFGAMANAPLRIYSGDIAGMQRLETVGLQLFWLMILIGIGWLLQQKGLKRLCVQGG